MDALNALPLGDNFYVNKKTSATPSQADEFRIYYQQSFNKMLNDIMSDNNSIDTFGSSSDSGGNDLSFLSPQTQSQVDQQLSKLTSANPMASSSGATAEGGDPLQALLGGNDNVSQWLQLNAYSAMIDKNVEYRVGLDSRSGKVKRVVMNAGQPYLEVNEDQLNLQDIVSVS